jgi:hypothetical protein
LHSSERSGKASVKNVEREGCIVFWVRPPISNVTLAEVEDSRALVKVSSRLPSRLR